MRHQVVPYALLAVAAMACESSATTEAAVIPVQAVAIDARPLEDTVIRRLYSRVEDRRRLVIRDAASWAAFWNAATATDLPRPPVPTVDFGRDMLIVAAMGTKPSGGFAIHIDGVYRADASLYAAIREVSPGPGCAVTLALTAPIAATRVARSNEPVVFVEKAEASRCD